MPKKSSYTPTWEKHLPEVYSNNEDVAEKASIAFQQERNKETTNSQKARSYEKGRAEEWQKNKHEFSKKQQAKNVDPSIKTLEKIKKAGVFDEVIPAPGFLLVEPEVEEVKSGYYIPKSKEDAPNTGTVKAVSSSETFLNTGDRVLFRKFAGIDMKVQGKACKFLQYADILAKVK